MPSMDPTALVRDEDRRDSPTPSAQAPFAVGGTNSSGRLPGPLGPLLQDAHEHDVLALIFRVLPPKRLPAGQIVRASVIAPAGTSLVSLGVWLYLIYGSDFEEHYATGALASVVLVGVWLYLSNTLILLAYRATQFRAEPSNGHRGGATAGRG